MNSILYVDLTERSSKVIERPDLFSKYLGGPGVASKLIIEETKPGTDPFSPESPIIFAAGYLVGIFPCMVKTVAMFKSPLTKNLGESYSGGHLASALRFAGYDVLVVHGASENPVMIKIVDDDVKVERADSLWGLSPLDVEKTLREHYEGIQSVISCGRAGERLIYYGNVIVDRFHHFGRLGLGAIFGSKKLKAISINGTGEIPLEDPLAVKEMYKKLYDEVVNSENMLKYHNLGTSANVLELNERGALPSRNFKESRFRGAERISGEAMAESSLERKISCPGCPVACIHLAELKTGFAPEHEKGRKEIFSEKVLVPYNYEPMYALGSNLLINEPSHLLRLIYRCECLGLDAMMVGTVLAWVTEAFEEGIINLDDTLGIEPRWSDVGAYLQIIDNMVDLKNPFYTKLAQGLDVASEKYGGEEFAMIVGRNGLAGYATGYGTIAGQLVGARHSHLSNSGYSIDQMALNQPIGPEQIAKFLINQEDWLYVLYSLGTCYFARKIYTKEVVCEVLKIMGIDQTPEGLMQLGKEIFHNLYKFKIQEGFELTDQKIPGRVYSMQTPHKKLDAEKMQSIIKFYIHKRESEGLQLRPEEKALKELLSFEG
ncbi:MAG: aldehyde ferredoxin oxidoreductase family protein [archaeon]|nr:aldehyde ferredoxin oxidoreductase family protein [archaeon]MCP8306285.1 aldehyde ferredoxin oxidoreductase family protein [archaeon]